MRFPPEFLGRLSIDWTSFVTLQGVSLKQFERLTRKSRRVLIDARTVDDDRMCGRGVCWHW
jgi:hypothetical protein